MQMLQAGRSQLKCVGVPQNQRARRRLEAELAGRSWRRDAGRVEPALANPVDGVPMTITARFMDGTGMTLTAHAGTTGHTVRAEIAQRLGVAEKRMKLIHGTGILQGDATLAECGVEDEGVLTVIMLNPLSEGTMAYGMISEGFRDLHADQQLTDEQVHKGISEHIGIRMALHDAMAAGGLLRKKT